MHRFKAVSPANLRPQRIIDMPLTYETLARDITGIHEFLACHNLPSLRAAAAEAESSQRQALLCKLQDSAITIANVAGLAMQISAGPWSDASKEIWCSAVTARAACCAASEGPNNRTQEFHHLNRTQSSVGGEPLVKMEQK